VEERGSLVCSWWWFAVRFGYKLAGLATRKATCFCGRSQHFFKSKLCVAEKQTTGKFFRDDASARRRWRVERPGNRAGGHAQRLPFFFKKKGKEKKSSLAMAARLGWCVAVRAPVAANVIRKRDDRSARVSHAASVPLIHGKQCIIHGPPNPYDSVARVPAFFWGPAWLLADLCAGRPGTCRAVPDCANVWHMGSNCRFNYVRIRRDGVSSIQNISIGSMHEHLFSSTPAILLEQRRTRSLARVTIWSRAVAFVQMVRRQRFDLSSFQKQNKSKPANNKNPPFAALHARPSMTSTYTALSLSLSSR
jgi:hypothetical protein